MRKLPPESEIFWNELQAIKYGFFRPDRNFIRHVRALSFLCDEHHTDDLFLAICKENGWNF
jgi:hypothetical protein